MFLCVLVVVGLFVVVCGVVGFVVDGVCDVWCLLLFDVGVGCGGVGLGIGVWVFCVGGDVGWGDVFGGMESVFVCFCWLV